MARIDVPRLLLLGQVARLGSLTATAAELGYSTSAISQQVAKLEREVGLPLVERQPRGVALTEAGRALVTHAQRIEEVLQAASADVEDFSGLRRGSLDIGTFPTAGASLLPRFIVAMRRQNPGLGINISSGRQDVLLAALRRHEVEITLLWDYAWNPLDEADIIAEPLMSESTVLLLPEAHALAGQASVDPADLAHEDWIVRAEHPVSAVLERVCQAAGFSPRVVLAANDYQEVQGMVAAGLGISLAPNLAVENPRQDVTVVRLHGDPAPRRIWLARLADRRPTPGALAAAAVFRQVAAQGTNT